MPDNQLKPLPYATPQQPRWTWGRAIFTALAIIAVLVLLLAGWVSLSMLGEVGRDD